MSALTDFTREAQDLLRDPANVGWYVVTLLLLVMYVYANEFQHRRWSVIFAGITLWLADWINEIINSLVLHFTDRAAIWTVTGETAYLVLIGLTIEISMMFALSGIVYAKVLPPNPRTRLFGMPNRLAIGLGFSVFAVFVEVLLYDAGVFHWEYWWWNWPFVLPIVVFGYLWFFLIAAYVHDMHDVRRQARFVGGMTAIVATALILFGPVLGWI
jgi:hypothetical protein